MRKIFLGLCATVIFYNGLSQVTIDPNTSYQTITGLGSMVPSDDEIYDLGVSMIRHDWSPEYAPNLGPANVFPEPGTWSFDFPSNYKTQIGKAHAAGLNVVIATVWSPPIWLKKGDKLIYHDHATGLPCQNDIDSLQCGGYLDPAQYDKFGRWIAASTNTFKQQMGFDLYAVSPQNEPEFAEPYGSCLYTADELRDATKSIGKAFADSGITNTKIYHGEILPAQMHVLQFFQSVNNDAIAEAYVGAFAIHNYDQDGIKPGGAGASQWASYYTESQRTTHKKQLWMTETSGNTTDMQGGMEIAAAMYNAMAFGNISLWSHFGLGKGLELTNHVYYVHKQYIRFIRPGAVRLKASSSDSNIFCLAFKNAAQSSFTILLINNSNTKDKTINISLPSSPGNFDMFRTSENEYCSYVGQTNLISINVPRFSVTTLVNVGANKLPTISKVLGDVGDTLVWVKSSSDIVKTINLAGISDGGEGNQTVKITTEMLPVANGGLFKTASVAYTSPANTGVLSVTQTAGKTGVGWVRIILDDQSTAANGFYSKKELLIPIRIIPFINVAPSFDQISNQTYKQYDIGQEKTFFLQNLNDGNGNVQKKYLTVVSSDPSIVKVQPILTYAQFKLVPMKTGTVIISVTVRDDGDTYLGGKNSTTKTFTVNVAGSGLEETEEKIDLFPNPAHEYITVSNPNMKYKYASIVDVNGSEVFSSPLTDLYNTFNLKSLKSGMYVLRLFNNDKVRVFKIMVQ